MPSTAIISAPALARSSISCRNGVMRIGLSGKSRFTIPIIGMFTKGRVALRLSTPSIRKPDAPPATEAWAIAETISGLSIGPSSTGWQEAMRPY